MARLSQETISIASRYVAARYSHLGKGERKGRRKRVIRALKDASSERVAQYVEAAKEALARSGM